MKSIWSIIKRTISCAFTDNVMQMAASVAFYAVLSLGPIVVITLAIVGFVYADPTLQEKIVGQVEVLAGPELARVVQAVMKAAAQPTHFGPAAITSILTLLIAANGVFAQLQESMNRIWNVKPRPGVQVWHYVKRRLISLSMLFVMAFLVMVSLISTAIINLALKLMPGVVAENEWPPWILNVGSSLVLFTLLFAIVFKMLPDAKIMWRDVWVGALVTSALFAIGKELIGLYLAYSGVGSAYGAAGSVVVFLVWIYYSVALLFLGVEFTHAYAIWRGERVVPEDYAEEAHDDG